MPSFLFSFALIPAGSRFNNGSYIVELPEAIPGADTIRNLKAKFAEEYGCEDAAIINWDRLPEPDQHPGRNTATSSLISYAVEACERTGVGCLIWNQPNPVTSMATLRGLEESIRSQGGHLQVRLIACKPIA